MRQVVTKRVLLGGRKLKECDVGVAISPADAKFTELDSAACHFSVAGLERWACWCQHHGSARDEESDKAIGAMASFECFHVL